MHAGTSLSRRHKSVLAASCSLCKCSNDRQASAMHRHLKAPTCRELQQETHQLGGLVQLLRLLEVQARKEFGGGEEVGLVRVGRFAAVPRWRLRPRTHLRRRAAAAAVLCSRMGWSWSERVIRSDSTRQYSVAMPQHVHGCMHGACSACVAGYIHVDLSVSASTPAASPASELVTRFPPLASVIAWPGRWSRSRADIVSHASAVPAGRFSGSVPSGVSRLSPLCSSSHAATAAWIALRFRPKRPVGAAALWVMGITACGTAALASMLRRANLLIHMQGAPVQLCAGGSAMRPLSA